MQIEWFWLHIGNKFKL